MSANRKKSGRRIKTDLARLDAHVIQPHEYEEIPELTDESLRNGTYRPLGRPVSVDPRLQVTIRLPESALKSWRSSGAGWQSRMAEVLIKRAPKRNKAVRVI
jgi:uncharacterized protein (DUF4415 family)